MNRQRWIIAPLGILAAASSLAANAPSTTQDANSSPLIPRELLWPGVAVIILIAIFVTAALAGPLIRANQEENVRDSAEDWPKK